MVTLSLGGAISTVGFATDPQARAFADKIWDMFLGGSGRPRPFGDAILDGYAAPSFPSILGLNADNRFVLIVVNLRVDLDIEQGISAGYAAFVNQLRERAKSGTKQLYVTAAPQCPFPDAYIGQALNEAPFDAVYVQFCTLFLLFVFFTPWIKVCSIYDQQITIIVVSPVQR